MLKDKLSTLPNNPGCYLMKDKNNEVIYVGKAKNLKNRVNSYFHGQHNNKTTKLVSNIVDFEYIVTPSEKEAFILEFNLIKKYKPRYNIMFMDDSSYPYLRLTIEKNPTLKLVRDRKMIKNAKYFGPYPNVGYARELLSLLQQLFPLRKCNNMPGKVCLYYHLGSCLGYCENDIDPQEIAKMTEGIQKFLNGDIKDILNQTIAERDQYACNMEYEKAGEKQKLINAIYHVTGDNNMQFSSNVSEDVFAYSVDKGYISIVGLLYRQGKLLNRHLVVVPLYDDENEVFSSYLIQYYQNNPLPKQLLLPNLPELYPLKDIVECKVLYPIKGDKKKLIEVAIENSQINLKQKFDMINKNQKNWDKAIEQLSALINWPASRIELFDNSHTSGSNAVAGQVVFVNGQPEKKSYRLYKVSNGNNDFANMKEVIYRRLYNALMHQTVLPDLIMVDGGESQIKAAKEIVQELAIDSIKILGLVKNDKHQTENLMDDEFNIITIDKQSDLFYLLTNMQDEVHRFAISYHQKLRQKQQNKSILDEIENIGPKRKSQLLKKFGSVKKIKEADLEQLSAVVGKTAGKNVYDYFRKEQQND
ncbi:MAG: excinuclease ABC subunit UvrC [Erysipelotrichaceae bacterium]